MMDRYARDGLPAVPAGYDHLVTGISELIEQHRHQAVRSVNSILTMAYWEIGRQIVEFEQGGEGRAAYGEQLLDRLSNDLSARYGRGFSRPGLQRMRSFYLGWEICSTPSGELAAQAKCSTVSSRYSVVLPTPLANLPVKTVIAFSLSWSHYVRLMSVENPHARVFYESEAIRSLIPIIAR
jgi:hypothetical protein